jgi:hypothetical protein
MTCLLDKMVATCFDSYKAISQDKGIVANESCNSHFGVIMAWKMAEIISHSIMQKKKKVGLTRLCLILNH